MAKKKVQVCGGGGQSVCTGVGEGTSDRRQAGGVLSFRRAATPKETYPRSNQKNGHDGELNTKGI